jgi:hypothetical protein
MYDMEYASIRLEFRPHSVNALSKLDPGSTMIERMVSHSFAFAGPRHETCSILIVGQGVGEQE